MQNKVLTKHIDHDQRKKRITPAQPAHQQDLGDDRGIGGKGNFPNSTGKMTGRQRQWRSAGQDMPVITKGLSDRGQKRGVGHEIAHTMGMIFLEFIIGKPRSDRRDRDPQHVKVHIPCHLIGRSRHIVGGASG